MITNKSIEKYLWISILIFLTYLFLGSFIVSCDFLDLAYLLIIYLFIGTVKLINRKK